MEVLPTVLLVLILTLVSAFFSAAEKALTAASRARMHDLEEEGSRKAILVNRLMARPERVVGTALLGKALTILLAASLTTSLLIRMYGDIGVAYTALLMTLIVVIFCEVLPKTFAVAYADQVALFTAPAMRMMIPVLWPLTSTVQFIVAQLLKLTPGTRDDDANILAPHDELRGAIELQQKEGAVARGDADMLGGVLDLLDLKVLDVMVHRTKIATLDLDDPPQAIVDAVLKGQYSRVPVWQDEPENIVGVLHIRDLLAGLEAVGWDPSKLVIKELCIEPWFVPDTTGLKDQLNQFLKRKTHFALVVDEYGEVQGLVTLEDILEEIVGQITDEHDVQDTAIRPQTDGTVNVDGSLAIRDLNRHLGWDLPDDEATTVAGLVIHEAQSIPEPGQAFTFYGYRFEILRKSRNRITALRIKPIAAPQGQPKPVTQR